MFHWWTEGLKNPQKLTHSRQGGSRGLGPGPGGGWWCPRRRPGLGQGRGAQGGERAPLPRAGRSPGRRGPWAVGQGSGEEPVPRQSAATSRRRRAAAPARPAASRAGERRRCRAGPGRASAPRAGRDADGPGEFEPRSPIPVAPRPAPRTPSALLHAGLLKHERRKKAQMRYCYAVLFSRWKQSGGET